MLAHELDDNRTEDVLSVGNVTFESLLLSENVLKGLTRAGFKKPSPIQLKAIPIGRCGFDLIVKSKSGTGKTLVFSVIALESVKPKSKNLEVLILVPTREIAVQIEDVIKTLGCFFNGLQVKSFIGGTPIQPDIEKSKNCNIAVGSPGRIKQLIKNNHLKTNFVKLFVLDEADKLFQEDFLNDINEIYNSLPFKKQIITSSATYSEKLIEQLPKYMLSPTEVTVEIKSPLLLGLKHFVVIIRPTFSTVQMMKVKTDMLCKILSDISFTQCLIFTNYKTRAESLNNILNQRGWASKYISAAQTQEQRLLAISSLKDFKCRILLSTDVTARGIDAANLDLIINYDIPNDTNTYLHRMGRAGRYGSMGICINLASEVTELVRLREIIGSVVGSSLYIPKLPKFVGTITELLKIEVPTEDHVCSIVNNSTETVCKTKVYENKPEDDKKTRGRKLDKETDENKSEDDKKPQEKRKLDKETEIMKMLNESTKKEVEEVKKRVSDMDTTEILDSLLNQNLKLESNTNVAEKEKMFDAKAVMQLLSEDNLKVSNNKDVVQKKTTTEEDEKESLFIKNKALLKVSQTLSADENGQEDQKSIEQHLNSLKTQEKNQVNELSKNSISDILNMLGGSEDVNKSEEKVKELEESQPSSSKTAGKQSKFKKKEKFKKSATDLGNKPSTSKTEVKDDLENVFQFGYDQLVQSKEENWKDELESIVKDTLEVEVVYGTKEEFLEVGDGDSTQEDSATQIPTHQAKKAKTDTPAEAGENDGLGDMKWVPVEKQTGLQAIPTCVLEARKGFNDYEDYEIYFSECSDNLWHNGLEFNDAETFQEWFSYEWEAELFGIRNCVQQSIYQQEMEKLEKNPSGI